MTLFGWQYVQPRDTVVFQYEKHSVVSKAQLVAILKAQRAKTAPVSEDVGLTR